MPLSSTLRRAHRRGTLKASKLPADFYSRSQMSMNGLKIMADNKKSVDQNHLMLGTSHEVHESDELRLCIESLNMKDIQLILDYMSVFLKQTP